MKALFQDYIISQMLVFLISSCIAIRLVLACLGVHGHMFYFPFHIQLFYLLIYLGFYVAFNTVQIISRRIVGRAEETSTCSSLGFCNCRPSASNYQFCHLRPCRESNPRPQRWEARVLPLCHRGPLFHIQRLPYNGASEH